MLGLVMADKRESGSIFVGKLQ